MKPLVLDRRGSVVDWVSMLIIRIFFLCLAVILFFTKHSRLTGLRFIAYYRSARVGLQNGSRMLQKGEMSECQF